MERGLTLHVLENGIATIWIKEKKKNNPGQTSLAVQWLRLHASTARDTGSVPGRGTKMPHQKNKTEQNKKPRLWRKSENEGHVITAGGGLQLTRPV